MLTESADQADSLFPKFYVKSDTNIKYMSAKILNELESA